MSSFDFETFCGNPENSDNATAAICALSKSSSDTTVGVNSSFLIFAGSLVFMMQAGFAMLCVGSVRQKNVKNILFKNLLDTCIGAIAFYTIGYGFAFGNDGNTDRTFIGNSYFALHDYDDYPMFFFQFAFAATAATIVAGTIAERCKMSAYMCYSGFVTGFVYPVIVHSIWSHNGFLTAFRDDPLNGVGVIDFAGSGVVHMTGGTIAVVAAVVLGPRKGRFHDADGNLLETPATFPAYSTTMQLLGLFLLWFGWNGFNPGSTLTIANPDAAFTSSLSAVTTTMAAAAGCVGAIFADTTYESFKTGKTSYDITMAINGCFAGLVSITAGCAVVTPWGAILIGAVAGVIYFCGSKLILKLRIDDAVDAIPVHLGGGTWGLIAVGFFADGDLMTTAGYNHSPGVFYNGGGKLLACQLAAAVWIAAWVAIIMTPFFLILNFAHLYRVEPLEEELGLDIADHRGAEFDHADIQKDQVEQLYKMFVLRCGKVEMPKEGVRSDQTVEETA